jgi:hypothetical protein
VGSGIAGTWAVANSPISRRANEVLSVTSSE